MKGLFECKASESNIRRIRVKDIVKEVEDYLQTYTSAEMDISCMNPRKLQVVFVKVCIVWDDWEFTVTGTPT
ncbi:hypothetical protein Tco_0126445 [Tanacetum coccineum]